MIVAFIYFVVGVLLGGLLGALIMSLMARGRAAATVAKEAQGRAGTEARATELDRQRQELAAKLESAQKELADKREQLGRLEAEKNSLASAREAAETSFKALSAKALRENSAQFLERAQSLVQPLQ